NEDRHDDECRYLDTCPACLCCAIRPRPELDACRDVEPPIGEHGGCAPALAHDRFLVRAAPWAQISLDRQPQVRRSNGVPGAPYKAEPAARAPPDGEQHDWERQYKQELAFVAPQ